MDAMTVLRSTFCFLMLFLMPVEAVPALATAQMELPEALRSDTERLPIVGYGGRNKGGYQLGPYRGEFTRVETRWALADPLFAAQRAKSSFTIEGPGFEMPVAAECGMKKNVVTVGIVTFDPKKMVYQCTFERAGGLMNARFLVGQPKPDTMRARFLAWAIRQGEAEIDGLRIGIRSVHKYANTKFQSPTPVGYLLEIGERPVAAVELTDTNPTLFMPKAEPAATRDALLLAAMALSVLRDPADSALGD